MSNFYEGEAIQFKLYMKFAENEDSSGQYNLGRCYHYGIGTDKDENKAFKWYSKSASGGNSDAQWNLGLCYHYGIGTNKDERKAFEWYLKSAEGGNSDGQCILGFCYRNGIGTNKDEKKGFEWCLKSAEGDNFRGQCSLGSYYKIGIGTDKDEKKAFELYSKSAENGYSIAQYCLGLCYENGTGTDKDEKKAFKWYLKSAENGYSDGQYKLGLCYRNGYGTSPNQEKAIEWLQKTRGHDFQKAVNYENFDDSMKKLLSDNNLLISWIPFNELKFGQKIGEGGFSTVYSGTWTHFNETSFHKKSVALKLLHGSKNSREKFIKEIIAYSNIGSKNPTFLQCYGVSKSEETGDYILVIQYAPMGSLRENLYKVAQMRWEKKLELLSYISFDLHILHSNNIIHCDLHSGNIFQEDLYNAYIGDLGFAAVVRTLGTESGEIYGVLPYIAPEVLQGNPFTKASDVYSFGMIMWEISSGNVVFSEYEDMLKLFFKIIYNDLRPTIIKGTIPCYSNLLKKCWDKNPEKRPSALEIHQTILNWKSNAEILIEFLKSDEEMATENNNTFNCNDDNGIYTNKFNGYINQQSTGACKIPSKKICIEIE